MKNISAALVKAQKGFAPALKASVNPHFKSKYVDLAGCVEAVIDSLNANGIFLMQPTHESESGVTVETVFIHESGEQISAGKLHVPASKQDAQGYGSALTYARRYSLMAACGIAPEDDDGNAATKAQKESAKSVAQSAIDNLPKETADKLRAIAMDVIAEYATGPEKALDLLNDQGLDTDEKVAIWSLFDSKMRSTFKNINAARAQRA